ncbi:MAG TPA: response regulator [Gemmatimonadales bacterium]|jgi:DNA-binding response OmpR family regulator|nr:response regulator [Gemmatimonadales bacterium]
MGKTVLIIDDDPDQRRLLERTLATRGYRVLLAADGEAGLALAVTGRPDAIVLDVMMPRLNGFQTCRRLKAEPATASVPVVMLTAKDQPADEYWAREVGANEYLTKPVEISALLDLLDRLTASR